jgi:2-keto-3-deoxy-L-rhamnonate aldolase RhmA
VGQLDDPEVVAAITRVAEVTLAAGLALGYFATTPEAVYPRIAQGFSLLACGVDTIFLRQGALRMAEALRGAPV